MRNPDTNQTRLKNIENRLERIRQYNMNPSRCVRCDKILPYEKQHNKYCCRKCTVRWIPPKKPRLPCPNCGNSPKTPQNKFCSRKCSYEFRKAELIERISRDEFISGKTIRRYYLSIRGHICEHCKNTIWNGVPIPLDVHHIDGKLNHNKPENIKILCPNCHTLTENYKSKNRKIFNKRLP